MAYQSFGSYGSFKFVPELGRARKIQQAREEERRGQVQAQQQLQQQQQSYMDAMRQKLRAEQENRDRNFRMEREFSRQYHEAQQTNANTRIENLKLRAEENEKFMSAMADFSKTIGDTAFEIVDKRNKANENKEYNKLLAELETLTADQKNQLFLFEATNEANLSARDASMNAIANNQAPFIGNINVQNLRDNGLGSLSVLQQRALLTKFGNSLDEIAEINKDFKYKVDVGDGQIVELTLDEAKQRGGKVVSQAYQQLKKKIVENLKPEDSKLPAEFVLRNFYQPAEAYTTRQVAKSEAKRDEQLARIADERQKRYITESIYVAVSNSTDPASSGTISTITSRLAAENPGLYKNEKGNTDYAYIRDTIVLPELKAQIEDGVFDDNLGQVAAFLDNQAITLGNNGKPVPLRNIKSSEALNEINLLLKQRERKQTTQREREEMSAAKDDTYALIGAAYEDDVVTESETLAIKKSLLAAYKDKPQILQQVNDIVDNYGFDDREKLDKESAYLELKKAGNEGTLRPIDIQQNMNWLTKDQRKELSGLVEAFNPTNPAQEGYKRADIERDAKAMFRRKLGVLDLNSSIDPSINWAATEVGDLYVAEFQKLQSDPKLTIDQVAVEARKNVMDYLQNGMDDPNNPFYVVQADEAEGTGGFVKNFRPGNYEKATTDNRDQVIKDITNNPNLLSTDVYLSNMYLRDLEDDIKNGRMITYTPFVSQIASLTNQAPYEIINQQLSAAGISEKIEPGAFDNLVKAAEISPKLQTMLAQPTAARINTAIIASGNAPGTVRRGKEGEQDVMQLAQLADFKAPPLAAAMWALETGRGATVHGPNALFNIKSKTGEGTTTNTKEFINGQWVNQSATWANYNSPLESTQALTEWANNAPGFQEAKTYRQAIEAIVAAGYATDPEYASKIMRILGDMGYSPDDPIMKHTGNQSTNPNGMSPTVKSVAFYKTGDVMAPGMSPSEHLDVKQVDNPTTPENEAYAFFEANLLDQYVEVDDPQFGRVGPEELTDKFYGKGKRPHSMTFYAPRKYRNGTHLGWDYPTANGSTLHLKNGARVVGGYQTKFGYKAIIEIPGGKRFSFLHGYKL